MIPIYFSIYVESDGICCKMLQTMLIRIDLSLDRILMSDEIQGGESSRIRYANVTETCNLVNRCLDRANVSTISLYSASIQRRKFVGTSWQNSS